MSQNINFHPKPSEQTPRGVKQAMVVAIFFYVMAVCSLLSANLGGLVGCALCGYVTQKAVVPFVRWYLIG